MLVVTCHPPGPQLPIMSHWRWSRADWDEMPGPGPGAQWHQPADTGSWTAWAACTLPPHTLGTYTMVTLSISEELMITWSWSWKTPRWCHCDQRVWCSPYWAPFLQWPVHTCTDITHYIPHTPTYLRHTPAWPLTSARDSPGLSPLTIFPNLFVSEVNILGKAWLFIGLRSGLASGAGARGERRFWMPNVIAEWVSSMRYLHRSLSPGPSISWGIVIRELCIIMIRRWPPVTTVPSNSRGHPGLLICFIGVRRWFKSWCRMRYYSWNCTFCL